MRSELLLLFLAIAGAPGSCQIFSSSLVAAQVPLWIPESLQGNVPPATVSAIGTPTLVTAAAAGATPGYAGTYVLVWAANQDLSPLTVTSNPSSFLATQTAAAAGANGQAAQTAWNCNLGTVAPKEATCTASPIQAAVTATAVAIGAVETETEVISAFTTLAVTAASVTQLPQAALTLSSVVTGTAAGAGTSATTPFVVSSYDPSPTSSISSSTVNTAQTKSANVFVPSSAVGLDARIELVAALCLATCIAAAILL